MSRVAHRKPGGDRVAANASRTIPHGCLDTGLVERHRFLAGGIVPTVNRYDLCRGIVLQARAHDHGLIKTDHQDADRAETIFNYGVGGQCGRDRYQLNVLTVETGREPGQHRANRRADADR